MNTVFFLMAEFNGQAEIPLEQLCPKYTGMEYKRAKREALCQKLPYPTHRATSSQKAPWLVHINDLAAHIDKVSTTARAEHKAVHAA